MGQKWGVNMRDAHTRIRVLSEKTDINTFICLIGTAEYDVHNMIMVLDTLCRDTDLVKSNHLRLFLLVLYEKSIGQQRKQDGIIDHNKSSNHFRNAQ